jgi:polyphosphate kinase
MVVESPVAVPRAMGSAEGRSTYLDADVGSLDTAGRLLALAEDERTPVPERIRILADAGVFVDDFVQLTGGRGDEVRRRMQRLGARQEAALERVRPELGEIGLDICNWRSLGDDDRAAATSVFCDRILPVLSPLLLEPGQPLPPPANLSLNVAAVVAGADGRRRFGVVELPPVSPRFVRVRPRSGGGVQILPVEELVAAHLHVLFPTEHIGAGGIFRVTRQGGVSATPGAADILTSVERQLRLERHSPPVRLEVDASMPEEILDRLLADLVLRPDQLYRSDGLLGMADLVSLPLPDARGSGPRRNGAPPRSDIFGRLDQQDLLVHFPYESYADSVVALLDRASADPALLAIKQTLYRAAPDGPTVRALVRAAERGASVVAVVELAARLDERRSVACARALDRAGAHVVYGLVGMRTHCPLTLVIRDGGANGLARYGVVGTGLQHPTRRPEGISLLSADPALTADLTDLFNYLTGYSRPARFRKLLVGAQLRTRLLELIRRETAAGPAGRIVLKVYRLVDHEVIDALYRAAQRGVRVDLVVSGACSLRPGLPGLSDGIRVVATPGRHFESSRLFAFGAGDSSAVFLSSGDLGVALVRQVDVAAPVDDPAHRSRLQATLDALVRFAAWEMDADGGWHQRGSGADDVLRTLAATGAPGSVGR